MTQNHPPALVALVHNYTHVVVSLNETRKNMTVELSHTHHAAAAIDNTIRGVCQLIDVLVAQEQRSQSDRTVLSS